MLSKLELAKLLLGFLLLCVIYIPLERKFSLHKQKIFRQGWQTDVIYFFIGNLIGKMGLVIGTFLTINFLKVLINEQLQIKVYSQPIWLQFIEAILISDLGYYIAHRLTHEIPWLWKFHAIHHSAKQMDWLITVRIHPGDQLFTKMFQIIPLYILGFNKETFGIYILFGAFIAFLIHANVRVKLGIFKWLIANPEFHHWHHSDAPKAHNRNYAAQFPFLDLIFGTLYMPKNKVSEHYGISDPVPSNYIGQLLYPFRF